MFNSKAFCVIIFLTAAALGTTIYFQTMEMMDYKLLAKLDKQYLSGTFTGGKPAEKNSTAAKEDNTAKKKVAGAAKKK
jgi:hypothetical protein